LACSDDTLKDLGKALQDLVLEKDLIGWDINGIEKLALDDRESDSDDESSQEEVERKIETTSTGNV